MKIYFINVILNNAYGKRCEIMNLYFEDKIAAHIETEK